MSIIGTSHLVFGLFGMYVPRGEWDVMIGNPQNNVIQGTLNLTIGEVTQPAQHCQPGGHFGPGHPPPPPPPPNVSGTLIGQPITGYYDSVCGSIWLGPAHGQIFYFLPHGAAKIFWGWVLMAHDTSNPALIHKTLIGNYGDTMVDYNHNGGLWVADPR